MISHLVPWCNMLLSYQFTRLKRLEAKLICKPVTFTDDLENYINYIDDDR